MTRNERDMKVVFGTATTAKTLTGSLVADTNSVLLARGFSSLEIDAKFAPGANGEFLIIEVCTSNDALDATPTNWALFSDYRQPDAASNPTLGLVEAVPFEVPAETASPANGTTYLRSFDIDLKGVNWIRVRARSSGVANFGTAIINAVLTS